MNFFKNMEEKAALVQLGKVFNSVVNFESWPGYPCGVEKVEFENFKIKINEASIKNPWFTKDMIHRCFMNWADCLVEKELDDWLKKYDNLKYNDHKTVLIICAGNLPLVGFHDILCSFILGYKIKVKLSSNDDVLIPAIIDLLSLFFDNINERVQILEKKPKDFDCVIATGSDNTNRYFEYYFGHVPNLFRKNRTSIAVIDNSAKEEDFKKLANDVFSYFGLGCRSVTKVFLPKKFNTDLLFNAFYKYKELINHNKYMNNYDYNRSIFLLQKQPFLENGFLILKEDENLFSPVSVVNYEFYDDLDQLNNKLQGLSEKIQCRVGNGGIPFGTAQQPKLWEYADGVDTINFLTRIL